MEPYELNEETIIKWAVNYASYGELESTAKALYKLYKERQGKERPADHWRVKNKKHSIVKYKPKRKS